MSFIVKTGEIKRKWLPMTASTAITKGTIVTLTSGQIVAAVAATTNVNLVGILDKTIAATDSDFAVAGRLVPVYIPEDRHVLIEADVTSGLVAADVGLEVDLTDGNTINRAASTIKAAKVVQVISTTKGLFFVKFNGSY